MAPAGGKPELCWAGKDHRPCPTPVILREDATLAYHASSLGDDGGLHDNRLIHGDNLPALRALQAEFAGRIACIYLDPPYNTGNAFVSYDDGVEHARWLSDFRDRLEALQPLLRHDGVLWITLDDTMVWYAKLVADEVFGRSNFICSVAWNSRKSRQNDTAISNGHNFLLLFARDRERVRLYRLPVDAGRFANPDGDPRGPWKADPFDAPNLRPNLTYPIANPVTGVEHWPPPGRCWRTTRAEYERYLAQGMIVFGKTGRSKPQLKRYLSDAAGRGETPGTWWDDAGTATEATKEIQALFGAKTFDTPKPERLLHRVISLSTRPGDWVLDPFAGSGTTGAVAHKTGRRWIMVELGDHCRTHIVPRLQRVIDGVDPGGVTRVAGWKCGGGYRYFRLV